MPNVPSDTKIDPVPHAKLTLDAVDGHEKYDLWRESIACIFDVEAQKDVRQISGVRIAQVSIIRRFIEENLSHPSLSSSLIAKKNGVSRTKLYTLFEAQGGVANYVRERRLRRALLTLADRRSQHRTIYDIALASGYSRDTAFSRTFRARYDLSPNEIRQTRAIRTQAPPQPGEVDRRYGHWLNHLSV